MKITPLYVRFIVLGIFCVGLLVLLILLDIPTTTLLVCGLLLLALTLVILNDFVHGPAQNDRTAVAASLAKTKLYESYIRSGGRPTTAVAYADYVRYLTQSDARLWKMVRIQICCIALVVIGTALRLVDGFDGWNALSLASGALIIVSQIPLLLQWRRVRSTLARLQER